MNKVVELLKNNFPELVQVQNGEYEVDIEKLKLELGKGSDIINEGYSLNWLGQSYSRVLRDCPTTTLIKPDNNHNQLKENINSNNVYIEGDNLEVLKHLKNAYTSKIKMIYIDPPYNTGSDGFVYNDSFNFDVETFMQLSGLDKEEAEKVLNYTKSKRNSHSAWLTFMYPRLYIARELLKDDGVIFISIDDNEQAQLKLLCDQIFGEENFIGVQIINSAPAGTQSSTDFAVQHSYCIVYGKTSEASLNKIELTNKDLDKFKYEDRNGKYYCERLWKRGVGGKKEDVPTLHFPVFYDKECDEIYISEKPKKSNGLVEIIPYQTKGVLGRWTWSKEKMINEKHKLVVKKVNGEYKLHKKVYLSDVDGTTPFTLIPSEIGRTELGSLEVKELLGEKAFQYPKFTKLIKYFIGLGADKSDIILDFFSGSSTTADAVMQQNAKDNGKRKFIMVQLPEGIDEKNSKEAYEFCTKELKQEPIIPTIAKERIKRAAKKIKEENKDKEYINDLDLGFKVYKTIEDDRTDVSQLVLFDVKDGIKTEVDDLEALLTTWMLHDGYDLNTKVEEIMINKYKGYLVEQTLYLLDKGFSTEDLLLLVDKLNDPGTPLINQIILNSLNFANKVLQEFHENVFSKNSKEAKIVVEDR